MSGRLASLVSVAAVAASFVALLVPSSVLSQTRAAPEAATSARDIDVGDPLRPVILNALRPAIVADLSQPVKFVVQTLRFQDGWAWVVVRPQRPDGREIDFRSTRYRERIENDVFGGPTIYALMQRRQQRWTVVDFVVGPTDVAWAGWPEEYGAPAAMLGLEG